MPSKVVAVASRSAIRSGRSKGPIFLVAPKSRSPPPKPPCCRSNASAPSARRLGSGQGRCAIEPLKSPALAFLWPQVGAFLGGTVLAAGGRGLHKALVIVPIMGWLGVGALLHQTRDWPATKPDQGVVVVVPPRPTPLAPQTQLPRAADRAHLSRELNKELKRVSCYEGEISSAWSNASRQAMRRFTEAVNAKLPIEEPDLVLLRLVQGQAQRVCSCSADPGEAKPSCAAPNTAETGKPATGQTRLAEEAGPPRPTPLMVGAAATSAAATTMARRETSTGDTRLANATAVSEEAARPSGPIPPADVYGPRRRNSSRRAESRPPAVVQSLVRDMQRALGSIGIR